MNKEIIEKHYHIWKTKPILQYLYRKWYTKIKPFIIKGKVVEIGSGIGSLKEFYPVILSDIIYTRFIDVNMDVHNLAIKNESCDTFILFDVLHHCWNPLRAISELVKALKVGGRIIISDVYLSFLSYIIYRYFHHERLNLDIDLFGISSHQNYGTHLIEGNPAICYLLFRKYKERFNIYFPELKLIYEDASDFLVYILSGGFNRPSLIPDILIPVFEEIENILPKTIKRLFFLRWFLIFEKVKR